jgi:hypothetical protein
MDMAGSAGVGSALGGAATASAAELAATGGLSSLSSLSSLLSNPKLLAQIGGGVWSIYEGMKAKGLTKEADAYLKQAFERSDPFAPARTGAMDQYMQWQKDPMSYMSSPLAQMQIDQMNRAARAKQAQLGQTWNIGADGGIQGSGIGAVDFAGQLQTNLAKQYETALNNRAVQGGMNLFPNMQALGQMGDMVDRRTQATTKTGGGIGNVVGPIWNAVGGSDILRGIFGA